MAEKKERKKRIKTAEFTERLSVLVSKDIRGHLEALAMQRNVTLGQAIRDALALGIPRLQKATQ